MVMPQKKFIKQFISHKVESIKEIMHLMANFEELFLPKNACGQVKRGCKRFALIAAAGELATAMGLTGWGKNEAMNSIGICFQAWLSIRGLGQQEEQMVISQIRRFFEQHGESRFTPWDRKQDDAIERKTINRAGYSKCNIEGVPEYFVFPEIFKAELCIGYEVSFVEKVCIQHGLLMPESSEEATRSERLPGGGRKRIYRFTSKVFEDEE
jgi:putative DNA primase/helicase